MLDADPDLNWHEFRFYDSIPAIIRLHHVKDDDWQAIRKSMLSTDLEFKYHTLKHWLEQKKFSEKSKVQTQNYVQALRRSGLIE